MNRIYKILGLSLVITVLMIVSCGPDQYYDSADEWVADLQDKLELISVEDMKVKYDAFEMYYLIDVREPNEYNYGYIPGAYNIPGGTLIFRIDSDEFWESIMGYAPQKEDEIIVYCKKGKRSVMAADALKRLGYTNVRYLDGGWKKWELSYPNEFEKNEVQEHHEEEEEVGGC